MQKQNNKDRRIGLYLNVSDMKAAFPSAIARAFESDKEFALSKQRQKEHYESVEQQHEFAEAQARRQLESEAKKAAVPRAPAHYSIIMGYAEEPPNSFKVGNGGVRPVRGVTPAFPVVSKRKGISPQPPPPPVPPLPAPVGAGGGSLHAPGKFAQPRRQQKPSRGKKTTTSLKAACEKALPPLPPPSPLVVASFDESRDTASRSADAAKAARLRAESSRVNDARRKRPRPIVPTESKTKASSRPGNGQSSSKSTQLSTSTATTAPFVNFFRPSLPQSEYSSAVSSDYGVPTALPTASSAPSRPKPKASAPASGAPITTAQISAAHREQTRKDISSRVQILINGAEPETKPPPPPKKKISRKPVNGPYPGKNALLLATVQSGAMSSKSSSGSLNTDYSVYSQMSGSNTSELSMDVRRV